MRGSSARRTEDLDSGGHSGRLRVNRGLRTVVPALAAVGLASRICRKLSEAREARLFPPPGELVEIGGRRLHLCRAGEGTPSVVIVPCLGGAGSEWWDVQEELAQYTSVYTYDRAGLGWSDSAPWPRTYARMADELHQLLAAAAIPPPYLVVGHSTGGIIIRQFAARHPEGLAGLVLVDSSHEDQIRRLAAFKETRYERLSLIHRAIVRRFTPLGLIRVAQWLGFTERPTVPAECLAHTARSQRANAQELLCHAFTKPGTQAAPLGDLPLTVLTAGPARRDRWYDMWRTMQTELARLSTRSTHIFAEHAGHHIHHDDPDLVVRVLREVITQTQLRS